MRDVILVCALALVACSNAPAYCAIIDEDAAVCPYTVERAVGGGSRCIPDLDSDCGLHEHKLAGECADGVGVCAVIAGTATCLAANRCDVADDATTCHCGTGPPCNDQQVCAAPAAGGVYRCICSPLPSAFP